MKTFLTIFLGLFFLAPAFAQTTATQTHSSIGLADSSDEHFGNSAIVLSPTPSSAEVARAVKLFEKGRIIVMAGDHRIEFDNYLDIGLPAIGPMTEAHTGGHSLLHSASSTPFLKIEAARLGTDGTLHGYECSTATLNEDYPGARQRNCVKAFQKWAHNEEARALDFPLPEAADWTSEAQLTSDFFDSEGNYLDNRVRLYRLNDISPESDWYMVVRDPASEPNFRECVPFGACGWYTDTRDFQISLDRAYVNDSNFKFYEWSPQQTITGGEGSLSLGLALDSVVPKPGVGYSFTWPQDKVNTTVYSTITGKEASWVEKFADRSGPVNPPPPTSTDAFISHQGAIFQVPAGTSSFQVIGNTFLRFTYNSFDTDYWEFTLQPRFTLTAPEFTVSPNIVHLQPNSVAVVKLTSEFPGYTNRLKWTVVSAPSWLSVSPTHGGSSTLLEIRELGEGKSGDVGTIELQTDPPYAAPSVESGPLRIAVGISDWPVSGVLLAGGTNWEGETLKSAEVWNPNTHQSVNTQPMRDARQRHTSTLLPDGRTLVTGGLGANGATLRSAELFNPLTGSFTPTGNMNVARYDHTATLMTKGVYAGQVLIAGGCCTSGENALASAEIYDPRTGLFTTVSDMHLARRSHTATLLHDNTILITGGTSTSSSYYGYREAEIFSPASGSFQVVGPMNEARQGHSATIFTNGQVLIAGGWTAGADPNPSAEIYNPSDRSFVSTGRMLLGRRYQSSTMLLDRRAFVVGGWNSPDTAEVYDVLSRSFKSAPNPMQEFRDYPVTALIVNTGTAADSKVLVAGGVVQDSGNTSGKGLELFNPASETFEPAGEMTTPRSHFTATAFGAQPY